MAGEPGRFEMGGSRVLCREPNVPLSPPMETVPHFFLHFANLVWLLVHRAEDQGAQKDALRRAVDELAQQSHSINLQDLSVAIASSFQRNDLNDALVWLSELSVRMSAHSVRVVEFSQNASPGDVLGLAELFTEPARMDDEGAHFDEMLVQLAPTGIAVHLGPMGFVRSATPAYSRPAVPAPSRTPASTTPVMPMNTVLLPPPPEERPRAVSGGLADERVTMLQAQLGPATAKAKGLAELLARLDVTAGTPGAGRLIEDVAIEVEERARDGLWVDLAEVLNRLHERYGQLPDGDLKRACLAGVRRLEKPMLMQGIARLLPRRREMREMVTRLLAKAGESGADALIDLLINSENTAERRAYRSALTQCSAAVPALVHLLGDSRWYVVRNAAELLGELTPPDADVRLAELLNHREPRVRRAAAGALSRFGTPRAVLALLQALQDGSPDVRLQVVLGLGTLRNPRAVPWLIEALDKEQDPDVQSALVSSLGMMPTEEAVARLARLTEPGGLLLRKSTAARLQAIEALGQAGTPSAQGVLRGLLTDRDRDVRQAAEQALANGAQTTPSL